MLAPRRGMRSDSPFLPIINPASAAHKLNVAQSNSEPSAVLASRRRVRRSRRADSGASAMIDGTRHGIVEAGTIADIDDGEGEPVLQGREAEG